MNRRTFCKSSFAAMLATAAPLGRILAAAAEAPSRALTDLVATTRLGKEKRLEKAAVGELIDALRGPVILPGDEGYNATRRIWNGMFDLRPAAIARCAGSADVMTAVDFARGNDLLLSVRGGGHSGAGYSVCNGGLMIDLSLLKGIRTDPATRTVRVAPGVLLGDLDRETQHFGLSTTTGTVSTTGVAGLTLGGGLGRLGRKFGLTSDNLLSVDLVTADGQLLHASEEQHQDLFWGVRGGGGNFGIVTSFEFRLHPLAPDVLSGSLVYPLSQAKEVLRFHADFAETAPDELTTILTLSPATGQPGILIVEVFYAGDLATGEKLIDPLRRFGKPSVDRIRAMPYLAVQQSYDAGAPHGDLYYGAHGFVKRYTPELIDALVDEYPGDGELPLGVSLMQGGGAVSRLARDATAYAHRDALADMTLSVRWQDEARSDEYIARTLDYWNTVGPHTSGFYTNRMMEESPAKVPENFRKNLDRLVSLKDTYDPTNLFRRNANIEPTAS